MEYLMSFLVSVGAQVIGHFLCKWLDPRDEKGRVTQRPPKSGHLFGGHFAWIA